jgi:GNAT superfamily N-acetyltransferase
MSADFICRYFEKHYLLHMLMVHPAYWRQGHRTALVKWSLDLAAMDNLPQGVIATEMGERVYTKLGFKRISKIEIGDKDKDVNAFEVGVLQFTPKQSG